MRFVMMFSPISRSLAVRLQARVEIRCGPSSPQNNLGPCRETRRDADRSSPRRQSALRRLVIPGIVIAHRIGEALLRLAIFAAQRQHAADAFDVDRSVRREA